MRCPRCKCMMRVVQEEAFNALLCESCGGMFYPREEFAKHLEVVRACLPERPSPQEQAVGRAASGFTVAQAREPCPGCSAPLETFNYAYTSDILLGKCPVCGGLWAEPGQMLKVARYREEHPGAGKLIEGIARTPTEQGAVEEEIQRSLPKVSPLGCLLGPLLPISNAGPLLRYPVVTYVLIGMNALLFFVAMHALDLWGLVPAEVTSGRSLRTLITHQFAHAGVVHLIANMIFLRAFADRVEDRLGHVWFFLLYLLLGVVGGLAHAYMEPHSEIPLVGASGAVSGILGLYFVLFPWTSVRITFFFMTIPVPALLFLGVWFGFQLLIPSGSDIAVAAHLGGFLAGAWAGGIIRILRLGASGRGTGAQARRSRGRERR